MKTLFTVGLHQASGELGKFTSLLASGGINIETISGVAHGDHAIVTFIPSDAEATKRLLEERGAAFEEAEVLTTSLPNRPGELTLLASRLGEAGANITTLLPLAVNEDSVELAMTFENVEKAREVLG